MNLATKHSSLRDIFDKVAANERISDDDALRLFQSKDLNALAAIANLVRERKCGNRATALADAFFTGFGFAAGFSSSSP